MAAPYIGEIRMWALPFAPKDWAMCNGQMLNVHDNPALYALIGAEFGGNGVSTFALPDLRGRVLVGEGTDHFGFTYLRGQRGGEENVTLELDEMPKHIHDFMATNQIGDSNVAQEGSGFASSAGTGMIYSNSSMNIQQLHPSIVDAQGGGMSHNNVQPSLVINYCISLKGTFPPRN